MSKILKVFTMSLLLVSIMIASFAGTVFAGEYNGDANAKGDPIRDRLEDGSCCEPFCDGIPDRDRDGSCGTCLCDSDGSP